jgi:beta-galactosidase
MKKIAFILLTVWCFVACHKPESFGRTKVNFGTGWQFTKDSASAAWQNVNLPHTAQVEKLVVVKQWQGDCWYKKEFEVKATAGEKVFLYFEGVMHDAEIYINNKAVARHQGGYTPFTVDVTKWVKFGLNTIALKVNNEDNATIPPGKPLAALDFNYYGGMYRNVYLITTGKLYITDAVAAGLPAGGGLAVHFDAVTKDKASGELKTHIKNEFDVVKEVTVKTVLKDAAGKTHEFTSVKTPVQPGWDVTVSQNIVVDNPKLWSVTNPQLYQLEVSIIADGKVTDLYTTKTGIRKIEVKDDGFYLNDEKLFINGTNRHQEYPYVGYAISDEAQYRDAVKIKSAGFDFVRLSHYPQSEAFLNACDELGILVMDCISGWQFFGNDQFIANSQQEIRDLARRDRNHPSVIIWEVSLNESEMSEAYMKDANEILREELPYKDIYTAGWMDNANYDLFIPARQHGKAPDYWNNYSKGNRKVLIAEYGDWEYYAQNAGFNQTAFGNLKEEERTSRQLRGSGEKRLLQQAFNFQEAYNSNLKGKNTIGHANWLMFDYNRGYSPDLESSGISDIFRIPKFAYYFYQSQRSPKEQLNKAVASGPMVHIASYWDENSAKDVTVYSNCDEVALYLNDVLVAKQKPMVNNFSDDLSHAPFVFDLKKFTKGTLRAEGFINGKKVTEHSVSTPGKAAKIELSYDTSGKAINKNTPDVVFVYAKITDENGNIVNTSNAAVTFTLEGSDAILTGDTTVAAEAGTATILLRTEKLNKTITIKASSAGLQTSILEIKQ